MNLVRPKEQAVAKLSQVVAANLPLFLPLLVNLLPLRNLRASNLLVLHLRVQVVSPLAAHHQAHLAKFLLAAVHQVVVLIAVHQALLVALQQASTFL